MSVPFPPPSALIRVFFSEFLTIFNATDAYKVDEIFVDVKKQQAINFRHKLKASETWHSHWRIPNRSSRDGAIEHFLTQIIAA